MRVSRVAAEAAPTVAFCVALAAFLGSAKVQADTALADAAMNNDLTAVHSLLAGQVDVNATQPDGMTALHWAAHHDDLAMADELLRAGAIRREGGDLVSAAGEAG